MKKFLLSLVGVGAAAVPAFAEGQANAIDTTAASDALNSMVESVGTYVSTITPYIITLLGGAVIITLLWVGWKLFRKGTNKVG